MPGGGWGHHEACIRRVLLEEVDAKVQSVDALAFVCRGEARHGHPKISLAFRVQLADSAITPVGDDLVEARFVTKTEFAGLSFQQGEASIQNYADQIWPPVEKNIKKK